MRSIRQIVWLDEVSSTNDVALQLASRSDAVGTAIVAEYQSSGRGRSRKRWISPRGLNVYLSVIVEPRVARRRAKILTLLAAVACVEAVRRSCGLKIGIKWPNDLVVGDRKLGGILVEARARQHALAFAVVGIGLNVNSTSFPGPLRRSATSISLETGKRWNRSQLIREVLASLDRWLGALARTGPRCVIEAWRRLNVTIGRRVRIRDERRSFSGEAVGIDAWGRLGVRTSRGTRNVDSGSLTLLEASPRGRRRDRGACPPSSPAICIRSFGSGNPTRTRERSARASHS